MGELSAENPGTSRQWSSFRGPNAAGIAEAGELPFEWNVETGSNIRWVRSIPGYSHSSPIVWGDRIFVLTSVSTRPEADGRRPGVGNIAIEDQPQREWRIYSLSRDEGRVLWHRTAHRGVPRVKRHEKASHANPTPSTNGSVILAVFNSEGLYCFDFEGRLLWRRDLGRLDPGYWGRSESPWGHASSPVIFRDLAIVQVDRFENSYIAAYGLGDGAEVWRISRQELATWSTPTLHERGGRWQVIAQGGNFVRGYDAFTGRELWRFADHAEVKVPTPFAVDDWIIVTGGAPRGRPIYALDTGGTGDISFRKGAPNPHLRWVIPNGGPYTSTPIAYGPFLYVVRDSGVFSTYDLETGELRHRQRLGAGFSASPVAADEKLFLTSEDGEVYVLKPGPEPELLATNDMAEPCFATPAFSGDMLVLRTQSRIYGIGSS